MSFRGSCFFVCPNLICFDLETYVGQHQPNPATLSTVTREGDKLLLQQGASAGKSELLPENGASFFTNANRRLTYSFVKDEKGQVTHLALQVEVREVGRASKIK